MPNNSVTLVGNITRDPELSFTPSGVAVAKFGLAVNERWINKQSNEWEEKVSFFNIVCWRDLADNAAETFQKGDRAIVTGKMEQRSWETDQGDKRSVIEVVADEVGPSIRWATAQIAKTERREGGTPAGAGRYDNAPANGGGGQPYPEEEPF